MTIDPALTSAFALNTYRCIYATITGESLNLSKTSGSLSSPVSSELDAVASEVQEDSACFVLFNMKGDSEADGKSVLIAWIPDAAKVRDKMLYSSSKEDLKKALGLTSFAGDYFANTLDDLTFSSYSASLVKVVTLNEREEALQQEKLDKIADGGSQVSKQGAMGVVPFAFNEEAKAEVNKFSEGHIHYLSLGEIVLHDYLHLASTFSKFSLPSPAGLGENCTIVLSEGFKDISGVNIVGAVGEP